MPTWAGVSRAQEIEISRRQSRDLATAPSVKYTQEPPDELKQLKGVDTTPGKNFIGFVSLGAPPAACPHVAAARGRAARACAAAVSKRIVDDGRLEKAVTLVEGYRAYVTYHVKATKSQLHTRIRSRSNNWLQAP